MHIPDGLLSPPVIVTTYAITIAVVAYSLRKLRMERTFLTWESLGHS
ncbi:energy-coupling factor ABC transporter permease [Pyrococcus sp. ST04]